MALLDEVDRLPSEYPGWMVELRNGRDPRGFAKPPAEAEIRAAAARLT